MTVETVCACAAASLLYPRFKKPAITSSTAIEQVTRRIQSEISDLDSPHTTPYIEDKSTEYPRASGELWELFDVQVAEASSSRTSSTEAIVETDQYLKKNNVPRSVFVLDWWKGKDQQYRKLSILANNYLAIPATSVASERVFSKTGELVSAKRSRLKPKHVDMMLLLNKNRV